MPGRRLPRGLNDEDFAKVCTLVEEMLSKYPKQAAKKALRDAKARVADAKALDFGCRHGGPPACAACQTAYFSQRQVAPVLPIATLDPDKRVEIEKMLVKPESFLERVGRICDEMQ